MYDLNQPWQQRLYLQAIDLPEAGPADAPLVCVSFNASWLPAMLGALSALALPSSWTGDEAAQQAAVAAATALLLALGDAEECATVQFQFTSGCVLQYSVDGGTTWIDVPGWPTYAPGCYTGATGPEGPAGPAGGYTPGTPSNPQGVSAPQQACDIAGFLATEVIKASLQQTVSAVEASETLYTAGLAVLGVLIGPDPVLDLVLIGANYLYGRIAGGTIAQYTAALSDATLWSDVTCAIYVATQGDGYVTDTNFPAVVTAVGAITYTYPDVIATLAGYLSGLGATGVQALQLPGAMSVVDCSGCTGPWCYTWDLAAGSGVWEIRPGGFHGSYDPGVGFVGDSTGLGGEYEVDVWYAPGAAVQVTEVEIVYTATAGPGSTTSFVAVNHSTDDYELDFAVVGDSAPHTEVLILPGGAAAAANIWVRVRQAAGSSPCPVVSRITLRGVVGTNPFGTSNCL